MEAGMARFSQPLNPRIYSSIPLRVSFPGCAPGPGDAFSARRAGDPSRSSRSRLGARGGGEGRGRARTFDPGGPGAGWGGGSGGAALE